MADQSVFKMSGAASEKLAALQNLSYTERSSTYEQDLSKLVCSFMRPVSEVNSVQRPLPTSTTNLEGPCEIPGRPLPFSIIKPAETWSAVGVRTVADLKTAMSSKKVPTKKSQSCDRGVDWRLRSSLYFDFNNERMVRLPYEIPGLAERAASPPLDMEGCSDLTSSEVLNAMRVLEPPKRPSPCKPYAPPRGNSPPRPQGTLPLHSSSVSVAHRRKTSTRHLQEASVILQPTSTPCRKARMKFTRRRTDLEKNPFTGLLEPKQGLLASFAIPPLTAAELDPSKTSLCENNNNNNNCIDKYSEGSIQDFRSEYASSAGSPSSGISADRRDSFDGSTPLRAGGVDRKEPTRLKATVSESSCQDSVISTSEHNPFQKLQPPNVVAADESQDVEFFDLIIAEPPETLREKVSETASIAQKPPNVIEPGHADTRKNSIPSPISTIPGSSSQNMIETPSEPSVPDIAVKQDVATQTQQTMQPRNSSALIEANKPKKIDMLELYKAVTFMKSNKLESDLSLDSDLFLVKGQLALPAPERMLV